MKYRRRLFVHSLCFVFLMPTGMLRGIFYPFPDVELQKVDFLVIDFVLLIIGKKTL
jgi:hypothetical protein